MYDYQYVMHSKKGLDLFKSLNLMLLLALD